MMFRAGTISRVVGASFFDAILYLLRKMDDWACTGPYKFTDRGFDLYSWITTNIWMITDYMKEYCLKGHVNIRGYVNGW